MEKIMLAKCENPAIEYIMPELKIVIRAILAYSTWEDHELWKVIICSFFA